MFHFNMQYTHTYIYIYVYINEYVFVCVYVYAHMCVAITPCVSIWMTFWIYGVSIVFLWLKYLSLIGAKCIESQIIGATCVGMDE